MLLKGGLLIKAVVERPGACLSAGDWALPGAPQGGDTPHCAAFLNHLTSFLLQRCSALMKCSIFLTTQYFVTRKGTIYRTVSERLVVKHSDCDNIGTQGNWQASDHSTLVLWYPAVTLDCIWNVLFGIFSFQVPFWGRPEIFSVLFPAYSNPPPWIAETKHGVKWFSFWTPVLVSGKQSQVQASCPCGVRRLVELSLTTLDHLVQSGLEKICENLRHCFLFWLSFRGHWQTLDSFSVYTVRYVRWTPILAPDKEQEALRDFVVRLCGDCTRNIVCMWGVSNLAQMERNRGNQSTILVQTRVCRLFVGWHPSIVKDSNRISEFLSKST